MTETAPDFYCARCGEPWPGDDEEHVEAAGDWVCTPPDEVPVCGGCATPHDRAFHER